MEDDFEDGPRPRISVNITDEKEYSSKRTSRPSRGVSPSRDGDHDVSKVSSSRSQNSKEKHDGGYLSPPTTGYGDTTTPSGGLTRKTSFSADDDDVTIRHQRTKERVTSKKNRFGSLPRSYSTTPRSGDRNVFSTVGNENNPTKNNKTTKSPKSIMKTSSTPRNSDYSMYLQDDDEETSSTTTTRGQTTSRNRTDSSDGDHDPEPIPKSRPGSGGSRGSSTSHNLERGYSKKELGNERGGSGNGRHSKSTYVDEDKEQEIEEDEENQEYQQEQKVPRRSSLKKPFSYRDKGREMIDDKRNSKKSVRISQNNGSTEGESRGNNDLYGIRMSKENILNHKDGKKSKNSFLAGVLGKSRTKRTAVCKEGSVGKRLLRIFKQQPSLERLRQFVRCTQDFQETVIREAKRIVEELCKQDETKTLDEPEETDQIIRNGIVYRLATDPKIKTDKYLYGNKKPRADLAAKAAGNEFRATSQYFRYFFENPALPQKESKAGEEKLSKKHSPGSSAILVPLQMIIDYNGHRVIAAPEFNIEPDDNIWLVYGSSDGGRTVVNKVDDFSAMMEACSTNLHLASHKVRSVTLNTAGDVQGYVDSEGNFYLFHLSRAFPPESPKWTNHLPLKSSSIFYRLFRPEFLLHLRQDGVLPALSSDALSNWGAEERENSKVHDATQHLLSTRVTDLIHLLEFSVVREDDIYKWVKEQETWNPGQTREQVLEALDRKFFSVTTEKDSLMTLRWRTHGRLGEIFHAYGVPLRHLNFVREQCQDEEVKDKILVEMVQRVLKSLLREKMREAVKKDQRVELLVADFLNELIAPPTPLLVTRASFDVGLRDSFDAEEEESETTTTNKEEDETGSTSIGIDPPVTPIAKQLTDQARRTTPGIWIRDIFTRLQDKYGYDGGSFRAIDLRTHLQSYFFLITQYLLETSGITVSKFVMEQCRKYLTLVNHKEVEPIKWASGRHTLERSIKEEWADPDKTSGTSRFTFRSGDITLNVRTKQFTYSELVRAQLSCVQALGAGSRRAALNAIRKAKTICETLLISEAQDATARQILESCTVASVVGEATLFKTDGRATGAPVKGIIKGGPLYDAFLQALDATVRCSSEKKTPSKGENSDFVDVPPELRLAMVVMDGNRVLMDAIERNYYHLVSYLISAHLREKDSKETASTTDNPSAVGSIDIDIDVMDRNSNFPLKMAVFKDNHDIANLLIAAGANVNLGDDDALYEAVLRGQDRMVRLLLENRANPAAQRGSYLVAGKSIFEWAVQKRKYGVVNVFLRYMSDDSYPIVRRFFPSGNKLVNSREQKHKHHLERYRLKPVIRRLSLKGGKNEALIVTEENKGSFSRCYCSQCKKHIYPEGAFIFRKGKPVALEPETMWVCRTSEIGVLPFDDFNSLASLSSPPTSSPGKPAGLHSHTSDCDFKICRDCALVIYLNHSTAKKAAVTAFRKFMSRLSTSSSSSSSSSHSNEFSFSHIAPRFDAVEEHKRGGSSPNTSPSQVAMVRRVTLADCQAVLKAEEANLEHFISSSSIGISLEPKTLDYINNLRKLITILQTKIADPIPQQSTTQNIKGAVQRIASRSSISLSPPKKNEPPPVSSTPHISEDTLRNEILPVLNDIGQSIADKEREERERKYDLTHGITRPENEESEIVEHTPLSPEEGERESQAPASRRESREGELDIDRDGIGDRFDNHSVEEIEEGVEGIEGEIIHGIEGYGEGWDGHPHHHRRGTNMSIGDMDGFEGRRRDTITSTRSDDMP